MLDTCHFIADYLVVFDVPAAVASAPNDPHHQIHPYIVVCIHNNMKLESIRNILLRIVFKRDVYSVRGVSDWNVEAIPAFQEWMFTFIKQSQL